MSSKLYSRIRTSVSGETDIRQEVKYFDIKQNKKLPMYDPSSFHPEAGAE